MTTTDQDNIPPPQRPPAFRFHTADQVKTGYLTLHYSSLHKLIVAIESAKFTGADITIEHDFTNVLDFRVEKKVRKSK